MSVPLRVFQLLSGSITVMFSKYFIGVPKAAIHCFGVCKRMVRGIWLLIHWLILKIKEILPCEHLYLELLAWRTKMLPCYWWMRKLWFSKANRVVSSEQHKHTHTHTHTKPSQPRNTVLPSSLMDNRSNWSVTLRGPREALTLVRQDRLLIDWHPCLCPVLPILVMEIGQSGHRVAPLPLDFG